MKDYLKTIGAKVSEDEFQEIEKTAKQMGLTKSEFVRYALFDKTRTNKMLKNPNNVDTPSLQSSGINAKNMACKAKSPSNINRLHYLNVNPSNQTQNFTSLILISLSIFAAISIINVYNTPPKKTLI